MTPEDQVLAAAQWLHQWTSDEAQLRELQASVPRACLDNFNEAMREFAEGSEATCTAR